MIQFDDILKGAESAVAPKAAEAAASDSIQNIGKDLKMLEGMSADEIINRLINSLLEFAAHLAIAVLVFYAGRFLIRKIYRLVSSIFIRRKLDQSLATFILSVINIALYFILVITVIGILGLETSSFLALFASAGVAVGLALSGTLQNFAGGVLILLLKPYKIGDYIEAQGYAGTVKEIQIFSTIINTADNKQIIIPNGGLSTSSVNNYSKEAYRRVDWTVSIAYGDDYDTAKKGIIDILLSDPRVVRQYIEDDENAPDESLMEQDLENSDSDAATAKELEQTEGKEQSRSWLNRFKGKNGKIKVPVPKPIDEYHKETLALLPKISRAPFVGLGNLNTSSVDLTVRAWTRSENYWGVFYTMNERFYKELPPLGINFPFPQLDVHLNPGQQA
ncbi:mechanosensitive ion channel domain-containing protein [uncultured Muribaculum sp.]|uniref:mechanosensitive ion channel family protein n=1 Tax=uncultured Muribaculum sp. TaxID=1918613 RepID=UPI0025DF585B|nr:mechanosensitive ion channel domain-containing protein [uncultured Muribaculum sp.]